MGLFTRRTAYSRYHVKGRLFRSRYTKGIRDLGTDGVEFWPKGWKR